MGKDIIVKEYLGQISMGSRTCRHQSIRTELERQYDAILRSIFFLEAIKRHQKNLTIIKLQN